MIFSLENIPYAFFRVTLWLCAMSRKLVFSVRNVRLYLQSGVRLVIANTEKVRSEKRKKNIFNRCSQLLLLLFLFTLIKCFFFWFEFSQHFNYKHHGKVMKLFCHFNYVYVVVTFVRGVEKISTLWKCLRLY